MFGIMLLEQYMLFKYGPGAYLIFFKIVIGPGPASAPFGPNGPGP